MVKKELLNSSLFLSVVYTLGHIVIAMACNTLITGANLNLAALDALIEPCINGIWFYILHKLYKNYYLSKKLID
tara:strand:- start:448 stop:669 length:222 start_codon:yes stop_codon:yes gene_type:complete